MASLEQLYEGLRRADAEGNHADVKALGAEILRMQGGGDLPPGPKGESLRQGSTPLGFANRAIAGTFGGPVDLADWALSGIGLDSEEPFGGSRSIKRAMGFIDADVAPEGAQATTYPQRGMEAVGAGASFLFPGAAAVRGLGALGPVGRGVAQTVKAPFLANAPAALGVEATASYGAGVGGLYGEEAARDVGVDPAYGRVAGELVGGLAGVGGPQVMGQVLRNTPAGLAARGTAAAVAPFTKTGARERARGRVGGLVDDPGAIPGRMDEETIANLTPAQRAQESGLLALDRALQDTDPSYAAAVARQNAESQKTLKAELQAISGGGKAAEATEFIARQRAKAEANINAIVEQAGERARKALADLEPVMLETDASTVVRRELDAALDTARSEEARRWAAVDKDAVVPTDAARAAFGEVQTRLGSAQYEDIPSIARRFLDPDNSNTVFRSRETVREVHSLYSKLREVARKARSRQDRNTAKIAGEIADAILVDMDSAGRVSETFSSARAYTREMNETFRQGRIGEILGFEASGGATVPTARTLESSLGRSGASGAVSVDELQAALRFGPKNSPEAAAAMQDYLRRRFTDAADPDKFLRSNAELLDRFPALKQEMIEATGAGKLAGDLRTTADAGLKEAQKSAGAGFVNAKTHREFQSILDAQDAGKAATALMRKAARDPSGKATAGLKAAALDHLIRKAAKGDRLSGESIREAMTGDRTGEALRGILTPIELRRVARIAKELDMIAASEGQLRGVGDVMADEVNTIVQLVGTTLGARSGSKLGAGTSGASLKMASFGSTKVQRFLQGLTNHEAERLLRDAALDKDLYKALFIPWNSPARIKHVERRLVEYLGAEAGRATLRDREPESFAPATSPEPGRRPETLGSRTSGNVNLADMAPDAKARFVDLQRKFGARLTVNSAVRTPEHNAEVGGAEHSRHLASEGGDALDIDVSGMSRNERQKLIRMASTAGYRGIGIYPSHIHIDTGRRRAWGGDGGVPNWAQAVIRYHRDGRFTARKAG